MFEFVRVHVFIVRKITGHRQSFIEQNRQRSYAGLQFKAVNNPIEIVRATAIVKEEIVRALKYSYFKKGHVRGVLIEVFGNIHPF